MAAEKSLAELVQWYDSYEQATMDSRLMSERDRDYYDGIQWTASEEATLKKRGQPVLTFNRIAPKLDFVLGTERKIRSDPKAYPRTPQEEGAAECATDAIRYVCDANGWDQERSAAYENMLIEGTGGCEVRVEQRGGQIAIVVEHIPWDRLFWDPRSRYADFRDAKFIGSVLWLDFEDAVERWPDARKLLEQSASESTSATDTHDDRPRLGVWSDGPKSRARIKVCQMYYRCAGTWYTATFTASGFLEDPRPSPYRDEEGQPAPAILIQSAKVDRDNNRYGIVRPLVSPQDEINKRRSKALHFLNVRQVIAEKGAVSNPREAQQELSKPDGWIERNPGKEIEVMNTADFAMGQFNLLADAKAEIDAVGANAALTGKDPRDQSGRAIMARQQGGLNELEPLFDNMRAWSRRTYKAIWYRIRQFWQHEMWIRVTDSEEHMKWVTMNKPVTMREMMEERGIPMPPPTDIVAQYRMQQVVGYKNHVKQIDVDIILDESSDTVTLAQEQFEQLAQMAGAGVPIPPDVLIEASALRNKRQLLERMRNGGATPEQQQQAAQQQQQVQAYQQMAAELELKDKAAKIDKTKADTEATVMRSRVEVDKAARESANEAVERAGLVPMPSSAG